MFHSPSPTLRNARLHNCGVCSCVRVVTSTVTLATVAQSLLANTRSLTSSLNKIVNSCPTLLTLSILFLTVLTLSFSVEQLACQMAEHKYDLWTVPPTKKTPKHYPWYSERLRQKYLSSKPSGALLSSNWLFVKEGGEDYRTGIPRETMSAQPYLTKKDGTRPGALLPRLPPLDGQKPASAIVNRKVPRRKAQMEYINVIESGLTDHPLAVFPHYEEAVAPDVFEEIVDTLDPDMRNNRLVVLLFHYCVRTVSHSVVCFFQTLLQAR